MQSSLVKPSAVSLRRRAASRGSSFDSRLDGSSCFHTESPGHLLPHNPAIMSSQVAQRLSAGTVGGRSGEAGWPAGESAPLLRQWQQLLCSSMQLSVRRESIRMFCYHMLLQGSERRPPVESRTKYRPPISMDLKGCSLYKGAHQHNTEGVQSRSSEGRLCSLQPTFHIEMSPVQGQLQICFNSLFFSSGGLLLGLCSGLMRGSRKQSEELLERRVTHCLFTYPWGIHFPNSLSIRCIKRSMAAYSEIKHNSSRQAGKQAVFPEKCILYEVKNILPLQHLTTQYTPAQ